MDAHNNSLNPKNKILKVLPWVVSFIVIIFFFSLYSSDTDLSEEENIYDDSSSTNYSENDSSKTPLKINQTNNTEVVSSEDEDLLSDYEEG
jgi:hypothetical protein